MPDYLYYFQLENVQDVFDAQAIWHAAALPLFASKVQLRELLERFPRQQKGRTMTQCFSQVRVFLPSQAILADQHLHRGSQTRELRANLCTLHATDFANMLGEQALRYQILPDASLEPQQIGIQFGHAVFVPDAADSVDFQLQVSADSAIWQEAGHICNGQRLSLLGFDSRQTSHPLPQWPAALGGELLIIHDGSGTELQLHARPENAFSIQFDATQAHYVLRAQGNRAGVEAGQVRQLFLKINKVVTKQKTQPVQASEGLRKTLPPATPIQTNQAKLCKAPSAAAPALTKAKMLNMSNSGIASQAAPSIAKPNSAAALHTPDHPAISGHGRGLPSLLAQSPNVWHARSSQPAPASAAPSCAPATPNKRAASKPVAGFAQTLHGATVPPSAARLSSKLPRAAGMAILDEAAIATAEEEMTYVPISRKACRVSLVALALPRLSRYPQSGLSRISFGIGQGEHGLGPLRLQSCAHALLELSIDDQDQIEVRSKAGQRTLQLPQQFTPLAGQSIEILPVQGEMQEVYAACLRLPHALHAEIACGVATNFGRASPGLAQLRVFEQIADGQRRSPADAASQPISLDRIGLSRKAVSLCSEEAGCVIERQAASQTLFHLDQDLQLIGAIGKEKYLLPHGHHLLAGHYVLRLELA